MQLSGSIDSQSRAYESCKLKQVGLGLVEAR